LEANVLNILASLVMTSVLGAATASQVSGDWTLTFDPDFGGTRGTSAECTFTQKDDALAGTCGDSAPMTGEVEGTTVRLRGTTGLKNEYKVTFEGVLDRSASTITGSWSLVDETGQRDGKFTLKKH
jgi:hypothetical protein